MRTLLTIVLLTATSFLGCASKMSEPNASNMSEPNLGEGILEMESSCIKRLNSIRVGQTRQQLEVFTYGRDGGWNGIYDYVRYLVCRCKTRASVERPGLHEYIKINVDYKPAQVSDAIFRDPERYRIWLDNHLQLWGDNPFDIATSVDSTIAYCEHAIYD